MRRGTQILMIQDSYEETTTIEKAMSLVEDKDVVLAAGSHQFAFNILVPSSTPSHERCQHGRVRHIIEVKAKGLGALGGDAVCEKQVFLIPNVRRLSGGSR